MARIGLVLGAGGTVGQAYHAGVLAALEHDLGWDPRTADLIVGSSAGSVTGTLLKLGVPAADLAAYAVESPLSLEAAPVLDRVTLDPSRWPPLDARILLGRWRPPPGALIAHLARQPWAFRLVAAAATLMPAGRVDLIAESARLRPLVGNRWGDRWPEGLLVCATRRCDGRRVVFGPPHARHPETPALSEAVAASCAIPGYFAPVPIDGSEYLDAGVYSPTNADVLRDQRLDLVVVVSPMSVGGLAVSADAPVRWSAHRRLEREAQRLRRSGTRVVCFEPGPSATRAMGVNAMATDRSDRVVQAAFLEAGAKMANPAVARLIGPLSSRGRHPASLHRGRGAKRAV